MHRHFLLVAFTFGAFASLETPAHASVSGGRYLALDALCGDVGVVSFSPNGSMLSTMRCFTGTSYFETAGVFLSIGGGGISTGTGASFGPFFFFADLDGVNLTATFGIRIGNAAREQASGLIPIPDPHVPKAP